MPPIWKVAHIKPIHKGGSTSSVSNYRPISLTSVCSKVMESIVGEQMLAYLHDNNLISKHQHGFLAKRSTCRPTNLLECFHDWVFALRAGSDIDVAYVDFSKAFDSVSHKKLLNKLYNYSIRYELLAWIKCFLQDRTQCVFVDDQFPYFISVLSGVIQGSGLGPLLFILFINDLVELFDASNVCKLFADDVKLYSVIDIGASATLEPGLACLVRWSNTWQLGINSSKCSISHIGRNNPKIHYSIAGFNVPNVSYVRDLGVTYDDQLKLEEYIYQQHCRQSMPAYLFIIQRLCIP